MEGVLVSKRRLGIPTGIAHFDKIFSKATGNKERGIPSRAATLVLGGNDLDYFAFQLVKNYIEYMKKVERKSTQKSSLPILRGPLVFVSIDDPFENLLERMVELIGWSDAEILRKEGETYRKHHVRRYLRIEDRYDWGSSGSPDTLYVKIRQARDRLIRRDEELVDKGLIKRENIITREGGMVIIYTLSKLSLYFGSENETVKFVNMLTSEAILRNFAVLFLVDPTMHSERFISTLTRMTDLRLELMEPPEMEIGEHFFTAYGLNVETSYEGTWIPYLVIKGRGIIPTESIKPYKS